eukprot:scaffold195112_cov53-Attheya_sp.AAC.1
MNAENLQRYQAELVEYNARKASSGGSNATQVGYRGDAAGRAPQKAKLLDVYIQSVPLPSVSESKTNRSG